MQLGLGVSSSNISSTGFCRLLVALNKLMPLPSEGSMSRFSHPSGNPASLHGNWSSTNLIWNPESEARAITPEKRAAFCEVVIMVTITLRCANILAMSTTGIMWPWAIKGNRTKWSWEAWGPILLEDGSTSMTIDSAEKLAHLYANCNSGTVSWLVIDGFDDVSAYISMLDYYLSEFCGQCLFFCNNGWIQTLLYSFRSGRVFHGNSWKYCNWDVTNEPKSKSFDRSVYV